MQEPRARLLAHFLPKFDNQSDTARLSVGAACAGASCLAVSKKHSGHLVMGPPFFSKNGVGNHYSRIGAILTREHFGAVWPDNAEAKFGEWWSHAEEHGLCYSFECVVL